MNEQTYDQIDDFAEQLHIQSSCHVELMASGLSKRKEGEIPKLVQRIES